MADPYQRPRAYSGTAHTYPSRSGTQPQPTSLLTRTPSFDNGDDAEYFDGGTGVARRQSVQMTEEQFYDLYARSPTSATMPDRADGYFAVTPGGNGAPAYNRAYSHDGSVPYPTTPGYNGTYNNAPAPPPPPVPSSAPGHQPYNPAAYQPQRNPSTAASYGQPNYGLQRQPSTYDPSAYTGAPYPHSPGFRNPMQVPSPAGGAQQARYTGYQYPQYQGRPQYPSGSHSYVNQSQIYPPTLPPTPSQSAPPSQSIYQAPPPPPPPHPPTSPGYAPASYPAAQSPGQFTSSYSVSQGAHFSRPETHYNSGSESDVSGPTDPLGTPHHPLPSPPKEHPPYRDDYPHQPLPSPPPPTPPSHGIPSRQQSQSRPLPNVPVNNDPESDLFGEVETSLMHMGSFQPPVDHRNGDQTTAYSHGQNGTNGSLGYYSNSSDTEAASGLEAMRRLDEGQEFMPEHRNGSSTQSHPTSSDQEDSDLAADYAEAGLDIGGLTGPSFLDTGFYGPETFSGDKVLHVNNVPPPATVPQKAEDTSQTSSGTSLASTYALPEDVDVHPFPNLPNTARVDTGGTGGLSKPSQIRRLSYDEGDEDFERSGSQSPVKHTDSDGDDIPELFYHPPGSSSIVASPASSRPLPSPPYDYVPELRPAGTAAPLPYPTDLQLQRDEFATSSPTGRTSTVPQSPGIYSQMNYGGQQPYIPRTTSLTTTSTTPPTIPPARSKTDGRVHPKSNRSSTINVSGSLAVGIPDSEMSPGLTPNDLPVIPLTRKFDPKKLSSRDFKRCTAPWALSAISAWLKEMTEGEQDLKEVPVADAVAALFTHHVPTMNIADAETLAARVVSGMLKEKNLVKEEEWVKFGPGEVGGVIYQVTGSGCYSPRLHEFEVPGRCYAHHCARTLRKVSLPQTGEEHQHTKVDWAKFWGIGKDDAAEISKKEVERQYNLHEIVETEEEYMVHMNVLRVVYRDGIMNHNPSILKPTRLDAFVKDVFGKAEAVRMASEEHLLPQLKFRQREQGPWIVGFSDIFREWVRKAKTAYLDYAAAFPKADMLVRREAERNMFFRQFLDNCRQDPRTSRLDWVTFLKGPITRLQRYTLLLGTVLKHTITETEEKQNLERAIEEIKAVTLECDARVDEMLKQVQLLELNSKLIMRKWDVDLRLEEKGRELIFNGDLQRTGSSRFAWVEVHCILFDHYLVLAKTTMQKEGAGGVKQERYDVSRMPIPMDLLVLESTDDEPVVRNAASRLGIAGPAVAAKDTRSGRHNTNTSPALSSTNTFSSVGTNSSAPGRLVTTLGDASAKDDKILYPFKIKHLGNLARYLKTEDNTTILYAPTAANRKDWCDKIILAKERHTASLHAQNAEPFRLKVMADAAFGYDTFTTTSAPKPIKVRGTPLDRAIAEVDATHSTHTKPNPICRASVNCATAFTVKVGRNTPAEADRDMVAIGTDIGVFIADANDPRGWSRAISTSRVTQITVLEDFSLFLVLADKALVAYNLDVVVPPPGTAASTAVKQKAPQKLSGVKDVGFFATGRMKERTLVFYKKREGLNSNFKVLEPVFHKATEKRTRSRRRGTTEFFREFDEFYIPADCYGLNIFHSSFAIQTSKGFEVMTLDKKQAWSVPELRISHVTDIATRLSNQKPLGMFRISDIEFLLCYEECAVYVNKHGDVSRSVIMEFVGKAKAVANYGAYVLVFDQDFVEIRNANNGRLRQVIAGRDVKCLDDGGTGRSVKVGLAHPESDGRHLVVELVLNEGQRD